MIGRQNNIHPFVGMIKRPMNVAFHAKTSLAIEPKMNQHEGMDKEEKPKVGMFEIIHSQ